MNYTAGVDIVEAASDIRQLVGCKHLTRHKPGEYLQAQACPLLDGS